MEAHREEMERRGVDMEEWEGGRRGKKLAKRVTMKEAAGEARKRKEEQKR